MGTKVVAHLSTHWRRTVGGISRNVARMHDELRRGSRFGSVVITEEDPHGEADVFQVASGRIRQSLSTLSVLKKIRPDILHCHDNLWMGLAGVLYGRFVNSDARFVYSIHTLHDKPEFSLGDRAQFKRWIEFTGRRLINRLICASATRIVAVTPAAEVYLRNVEGMDFQHKVEIIPFGADIAPPDADAVSQLRSDLGIDDDTLVLSTVGVFFHEWKVRGIEILLECVQRLSDSGLKIVLIVVGDGQFGERLRAKAATLGVQRSVRFLGNMSSSDLALAATDIYCHAALNEAQGMAVVEAMLYGLPIIVADRGGLPFVIQHGETGLVVDPSPGQFAAGIQVISRDRERAELLGRTARADALKRFAWPAVMDRFESVYGLK
jgi:glycosyltransferase involved in cell wall biosynthesis